MIAKAIKLDECWLRDGQIRETGRKLIEKGEGQYIAWLQGVKQAC